jgi:hypothetical protein
MKLLTIKDYTFLFKLSWVKSVITKTIFWRRYPKPQNSGKDRKMDKKK